MPVGKKNGYRTRTEHHAKTIRLQVLRHRLVDVEKQLAEGTMSACRGKRQLARVRHHLEAANMTTDGWRERWTAERLFLCADGEKDKLLGNETIRWDPTEQWLELKLPQSLIHLANGPHGRYRLSCPVDFTYRGDEVAGQATSGAVRYDVTFDAAKHRWYLDASWKLEPRMHDLDELRREKVLAVDLNHGHLEAQCSMRLETRSVRRRRFRSRSTDCRHRREMAAFGEQLPMCWRLPCTMALVRS